MDSRRQMTIGRKRRHYKWHTILIILISGCLLGNTANAADPRMARNWVKNVERSERLPFDGMRMVKSNGGNIYMISDNGKYVFEGKLIDTWNQIVVTDFDDLRESMKLNFKNLGLDIGQLFTIQIGHGLMEVNVFIDFVCSNCTSLLKHIQQSNTKEKYTYNVIIIPLLGGRSNESVQKLVCATPVDQVLNKLVTKSFLRDPVATKCPELERPGKGLVTAKMFGVTGVPFTIAPNGEVVRGFNPTSYDKQIAEKLI